MDCPQEYDGPPWMKRCMRCYAIFMTQQQGDRQRDEFSDFFRRQRYSEQFRGQHRFREKAQQDRYEQQQKQKARDDHYVKPRRPVDDSAAAELTEQLPRLIQLCHPDKHANSEASVKATQWLLDIRKRLNQ